MLDFNHFEVRRVGNRVQVDAVGFGRQYHLGQGQELGHVVLGFLRQGQVPVVGGQAEFFVALDCPAHRAFAGIIGRQGQQPVAVEHVMQTRQIVQSGGGGGGDVAAAVVGAGLAQVEVAPCRGNELPQADRIAARIRHGVVGTFNHWQQRQLQGHVAFFKAFDDVMNVEAAAFAGILQKGGVAGEPQALLLDARVDADTVLQLKAPTHAFPDVLGHFGARLL